MDEGSPTCVSRFETLLVEKSEEFTVFRVAINNEAEAKEWLQEYSKISRTEWIVGQPFKPVR